MTEGNWIAMPGVPLITAGDPKTIIREEGEVTDAPGDGVRAAEEMTGPTADEEHVNRAAGPSDEAERTEAAEETVPPAPASPGAASVPEAETALVPDEAALVAVDTEENVGGDASETRTPWISRPHCLPPALPGAKAPRSLELRRQPKIRSSSPKLRSERAPGWLCKQTKTLSSGVVVM
jgi:hypothetical protein